MSTQPAQSLSKGLPYGIAFEGSTSVDALMKLIQMLEPLNASELLVLPFRVNDEPSKLAARLDALSLEGFRGIVAISVLGIKCTDDALFAILNLRDALGCPELTIVAVASCEERAELVKALAIGGFSDLPTQQPVTNSVY